MSQKKTDLGNSSRSQYTRSYTSTRGVDFVSDPSFVDESRSPNLLNMYRDYGSEHGAAIETIPGYRCLFDFSGAVHGIWGYASSQDEKQTTYVLVHSGTKLFAFQLDKRDSGEYEECFDGLADRKSSAFLQNNNFYICDGEGIYVLSPHERAFGELVAPTFDVQSLEDAAYRPITYLSGAAYEQRNMLSDKFINRNTAVVNGRFGDGIEEIELEAFKRDEQNSAWHNFIKDYEYELRVWSDQYYMYKLTGLKGEARIFDELDARQLIATYGTDMSGVGTGRYWVSITKELIEKYKIKRLIGPQIQDRFLSSSENVTITDEAIAAVEEYYSGEEEDTPMYGKYVANIPIYEPCIAIEKVTVNGEEIPCFEGGDEVPDVFYMPVRELSTVDGEKKWYYSFIHIYAKARSDIDSREVDIYGVAAPVKLQTSGAAAKRTDYLNANKEYKGTSKEAILGCGISATFDGRVFLTGNSKLPNTVFYSCRDLTGFNNPAYYGVYNYFNDGTDNAPNVAMLATSSILMVLKDNTISGSAIYYHRGEDGGDDLIPRIYPSTPGVAGLGCKGATLNFLDDAVFISDRGLEGISKEALNSERTVGHRSSMIDRVLKGGKDVTMCRWGGYLCIFDGTGQMFLGDSRQLFTGIDGNAEYEWFFISGLFGYAADYRRFKTVTVLPEAFEGATVDGVPLVAAKEEETVGDSRLLSGLALCAGGEREVYYTEVDGKRVLCDTDGELIGGMKSPACVGFSVGDILFFGTDAGHVCCFNTDKRGIMVDGDEVAPDAIHRSFYTFAGHRYGSHVAFKSDNCGVSHLTKRTTPKTCVMKLKAMLGSLVKVRVRTDRETWEEVATSQSNNVFSFDDVDFDNFTFDGDEERIITVKEKKKKWVEKQFLLTADGYMTPFGFYSLTYNYEIQGRVKK